MSCGAPDDREVVQLTQLCLDGDQLAVRKLVERFRHQVYGLCRRMLAHHHDAEDAVQETFVRAFRYLKSWDSRRSFEHWLLAIAGNRCRTALAQRRHHQELALEHDPCDRAADSVSAELLAEEISLAMRDMRAEYRQCFLLFHQHHHSYDEIATIMGHPVGTVKTWVHRARRELGASLSQRGVVTAVSQAPNR